MILGIRCLLPLLISEILFFGNFAPVESQDDNASAHVDQIARRALTKDVFGFDGSRLQGHFSVDVAQLEGLQRDQTYYFYAFSGAEMSEAASLEAGH